MLGFQFLSQSSSKASFSSLVQLFPSTTSSSVTSYKQAGEELESKTNYWLLVKYLQKYLTDNAIDCPQFSIDDAIHFQLMVNLFNKGVRATWIFQLEIQASS